jgi:Sec-independent protein translocase protein TatA
MEPPVIFFNSIIIILAILVIFLPAIVKSIARLLGKGKKEEMQKQPAEPALQLFKDSEALSESEGRVQAQLAESMEWLPEVKQGACSRINQLPPLKRAVVWAEILAAPVGMKGPRLY